MHIFRGLNFSLVHGIMEYWNVGFEKEVLTFEYPLLQCQKGRQISRHAIAPKAHYSTIPILSEAN